jgi:ribosomal protein S6/ribosomal protein S18
MPLYEHVFLTRQDASAQQVEDLTAQFKGIFEQMGGKVAKTEQWGVKSLSYRLRKNRKAHFTLFNVDAPRLRSTRSSARSGSARTCCATSPSRGRARGRPFRDDAQGRSRPRARRSRDSAFVIATAAVSAIAIGIAVSTAGPRRPSARATALTTLRCRKRGVTAMAFLSDADPPPVLSPPQDLSVLGANAPKIDYKDVRLFAALRLRARQDRAEPDHAVSAKKQRELARAIKRARFLGLLPYVIR